MKMETIKLSKLALAITGFLTILIAATSCSKTNSANPGSIIDGTGIHHVDPNLVGKWMWTQSSDAASYDNNGVYTGAAYGLALEYTINADGSGTCFNHLYSTIGIDAGLEVNISSNGFFESDDQGHLGYFPLGGTYKSSGGTNRALKTEELWNTKSGTGFRSLYQKLVLTTQGGRQCFQVTASDGTIDTYFKVP